jgi:hypothetical protein
MKIIFFASLVLFFFILVTMPFSYSTNENISIEEWKTKLSSEDFKNKNITKTEFEVSNEQYYHYTRAWNATMYEESKKNQGQENELPHKWWTGITLHRIGEIDPISGTYEMDFDYWIQIFNRTDDDTNFKNKDSFTIDFVNSADIDFKESKGIKQKNHVYVTEVNGKFYTTMDFTKFPFEKLNLEIIIEPGNNTAYDVQSDNVQFQRWPFPVLSAEGVPSSEYKITDYSIDTFNNKYSEGDTYSRYIANFEIQRDYFGAFLKYLFPIIVMAGLAGAALIFPSEEYMTKIELNAIFLLGILFFVQVIVGEIPASGDVTIFDAVVIMSYLVIMVTIGIPAIKWKTNREFVRSDTDYEEWKDDDRRKRDLFLGRIEKIQTRMLYLTSKIQILEFSENDVQRSKILEELDLLEKLRIQVTGLKRIERDIVEIAKKDIGNNPKGVQKVLLKEKIDKINEKEKIRKNQINLIKNTKEEIKKIVSNENAEGIYNQDQTNPNDYFDTDGTEKSLMDELKIVSWEYLSDKDTMDKFNKKMNLLGLISGIGYYWINSIFIS